MYLVVRVRVSVGRCVRPNVYEGPRNYSRTRMMMCVSSNWSHNLNFNVAMWLEDTAVLPV